MTGSAAHERCVGCGAMDEELAGPCVLYEVCHSTVPVDADGQLLSSENKPNEE